jgi:hypothetical protein
MCHRQIPVIRRALAITDREARQSTSKTLAVNAAIRKLSGGLLLLPLSRAKGEAWAPASNYVRPVSAARAASQP